MLQTFGEEERKESKPSKLHSMQRDSADHVSTATEPILAVVSTGEPVSMRASTSKDETGNGCVTKITVAQQHKSVNWHIA